MHVRRGIHMDQETNTCNNQKKNGKPGPEFVNLKDVESCVKICIEFFKLITAKETPLEKYNKLLFKELNDSKKLFDSNNYNSADLRIFSSQKHPFHILGPSAFPFLTGLFAFC